ncbi:S-adenosyl-l-methionine hydroxide adenosyltransferase family protein [Salinarchaeum chitinilyticum]
MLTLASDFGSPYPAAMRAAIRQHCDAEILDVAHDFPRQDVRTAAFWLREVLPYAPPAVHCAVVDPGVGSDRSAIAVRVGEHALVAPDNGLALPAARGLLDPPPVAGSGLRGVAGRNSATDAGTVEPGGPGESPVIEVFEILVDDAASSTFHGRDVFAPAAALIHERGVDQMETCPFLEPTESFVDLRFPDPVIGGDAGGTGSEAERIGGEVLVVDGFGNAITNVPGDVLAGRDRVDIDGRTWPVADHYAAESVGDGLVTVGSHGNVELAVNRGRGADRFGVAVGDSITLR